MRVYNDFDNVEMAIEQGKSEDVIKRLWFSCKQGEAYREYMEKAKDEYEQTYILSKFTIVYDSEKEETKVDEATGETTTVLVPDIPQKYLNEDGTIKDEYKDYDLVPSLDLWLKEKDAEYVDVEPTDEEFQTFWAPYAAARAKAQKEKELNELKVEYNTVLYDANGKAIGNMASVVGIANWKFNQSLANGTSAADAYQAIYKDTKVNWRGADNVVHTVEVESICEALQNSMLEVAKVIGVA